MCASYVVRMRLVVAKSLGTKWSLAGIVQEIMCFPNWMMCKVGDQMELQLPPLNVSI